MVALARQSAKNDPPWPAEGQASEDQATAAAARAERRSQRRLGPSEIEQLVLARLAGGEIRELAEQFGVHRATVENHLKRHEVPHRAAQGRTLSEEQIQAAGELYASGLSLVAVGERFEVDRRYLRRVLAAAGFGLRGLGRQSRY